MLMTVPSILSDDDLIVTIASLDGVERTATASLIAHLAELEARNLHLAHGFRSLFGYCRHVLHCSEHEAYNRMEAVHAARRFPVILGLLAEGRLHLTAVRLLAPHLRDEDHLALLGGAIHKSRREIVALLARWFPSPDVASSIRKLPTVQAAATAAATERSEAVGGSAADVAPESEVAGGSLTGPPGPEAPISSVAGSTPVPASAPLARGSVVAPLSADRYRLQVTLQEAAHDDLRCLQDLMRREIPDGDPAAIVARALKLLRQAAEKRAFAATSKPRPGRTPKAGSRHIPASVERAVWRRDGGQCAFVAKNGRRCSERSYIEYHHADEPHAFGGEATVENISLRCRAHNVYESELIFGPFDPRRVRETPAVYERSIGSVTGPGTSSQV